MRRNRQIIFGGNSSSSSSDVVTFSTTKDIPDVGDIEKIYKNTDDGTEYKWDEVTSSYIELDTDTNDKLFNGTVNIAVASGDTISVPSFISTVGTYNPLDATNHRQVIEVNGIGGSPVITGSDTFILPFDIDVGDIISIIEI